MSMATNSLEINGMLFVLNPFMDCRIASSPKVRLYWNKLSICLSMRFT